jgi:hypothetical protein
MDRHSGTAAEAGRPITRTPDDIRRRARWKIAAGIVLAVAWVVFIRFLHTETTWTVRGLGIGVPAVPFLIGVLELISGRSFSDLSRRWDALKGWQRGLIGTAVVAATLTIAIFFWSFFFFSTLE